MTELIWDGKYKDEKKQGPVRIALPFQTVETVNESTQDRRRNLELFASGRDTEWRNRLIWGDKKYVLPSLLPEFAGKVNLIYIDPPFDTGADFSFTTAVPQLSGVDGESETTFVKEPSILEQKAYRDTWGRGMDTYLAWLHETALMFSDLLSPQGSLYVHVGPAVSHYVKAMLDEVFGERAYLNEIIWKRTPHAGSSKARSRRFPINHECLHVYVRGSEYVFKNQFVPYEAEYVKRFTNPDNDPRGPWQAVSLATYSEDTFNRLKRENMLIPPQRKDAGWRYKWFLSETKGKQVEDIWDDVGAINSMADERTGYPTQSRRHCLSESSKLRRMNAISCLIASLEAARRQPSLRN